MGDRELRLDLYLPTVASAEAPVPLVMWLHGGGWRNGSYKNAPSWLVQYGIAVASVEQRPITEIGWPAQIEDPRDALAFLRARAGAAYPIDPARFGAFGGSSGGHLVALLGTASSKHGRPESAVQAVCDMFGPTDLLSMPPNTLGYGRDIGRERTLEDISTSNGAVMLGATVRDIPERAKEASAFWQADGSACPFLFLHGDEDFGVRPSFNSSSLQTKVRLNGSPISFSDGTGARGTERKAACEAFVLGCAVGACGTGGCGPRRSGVSDRGYPQ